MPRGDSSRGIGVAGRRRRGDDWPVVAMDYSRASGLFCKQIGAGRVADGGGSIPGSRPGGRGGGGAIDSGAQQNGRGVLQTRGGATAVDQRPGGENKLATSRPILLDARGTSWYNIVAPLYLQLGGLGTTIRAQRLAGCSTLSGAPARWICGQAWRKVDSVFSRGRGRILGRAAEEKHGWRHPEQAPQQGQLQPTSFAPARAPQPPIRVRPRDPGRVVDSFFHAAVTLCCERAQCSKRGGAEPVGRFGLVRASGSERAGAQGVNVGRKEACGAPVHLDRARAWRVARRVGQMWAGR